MSQFNTFQNNPLIPNSQQYVFQKKYISIHSEDRDIIKYPISSSFEIELPQDYINVQTVKLSNWTFPSNFYVFSQEQYNINFVFSITNPYNPYENSVTDPVQQAIFVGLNNYILQQFTSTIQEGTYTSNQIATELTNKMNQAVTNYLITFFTESFPNLLNSFLTSGGYQEFVVVYNEVSLKLWFGNTSSQFVINNSSIVYCNNKLSRNTNCYKKTIPQYINWGLPWYLGFTYSNVESETTTNDIYDSDGNLIQIYLPRFDYGYTATGSEGYWLVPSLTGAKVYFVEAPGKININTEFRDFYMDIVGLNNIDVTYPFAISDFTQSTNQTNGIVDGSFAKITTPSSINSVFNKPLKYFNPPVERLRRFYINIHYHDGSPVLFGNTDFTFMLELGLLTPQNKLQTIISVPECIKYTG